MCFANEGGPSTTKERPANLSHLALFCEFRALFLFAAYHSSLDFEDRVRSWSGACGICGGESGTGLVLK